MAEERQNSRRWLGATIAGVALACLPGCGFRSALDAIASIRRDIQAELHVDANVNVNEFNGNVVVTVTLQTRPGGDLDVARDRAVAIVRHRLARVTRVEVFARL